MEKIAVGAALWAALGLGVSLAQTNTPTRPDAGAELQRQEEQRQQLRQRQEAAPDVRWQASAGALTARLPHETPCRVIHVVRIEQPGGAPSARLARALAGPRQDDPPQGRCLGAQGIALLLDRATNALVAEGLITSRAQALPQDLASGELVIGIQLGLVGRVVAADVAQGPPWPRPAVLATGPGQVLNLRDLEQSLENLRRNPSVDADIEITPGGGEGHSDILIHRRQGRPLRLDLALDDSGSRSTGRWQASATLSWDSPLGLSDLAYVSVGRNLPGWHGDGLQGSGNALVHYSLPLGYWLVSATASRNRYHQQVAGAFQDYRYSGQASQAELQLGRVLRRGTASKTMASLKAFSRRAGNAIDDTEVLVQRRRTAGWEAALQHTHYLGPSTFDIVLSHRRSTGAFGAMPAPEEPFGEGTSRMRLTQAGLSLRTPIALGEATLHYSGQWRAQWHHTPLTPQDRLCLGGHYTVRGFDGEQSVCGERGLLVRHEVSGAALPFAGQPFQLYAALDAGRVQGPSAPDHPLLAGLAVGLRWAAQASGGVWQLDTFIGRPLRRPSGLHTATTTAGLSLNASF